MIVSGGRSVSNERNLDIEKHGNGPWREEDGTHWEHYGYKSWQQVFEWPTADKSAKVFRVEIQVGTLVTQAWAEVQHNIIYKNPDNVLATKTMKRMIDGINGLAITTEIMLEELQRGLEVAKKEAEELEHRPFCNGYEFEQWFDATYLRQMPADERARMRWHSMKAIALVRRKESLCRADVRAIIAAKGSLQSSSSEITEVVSIVGEALGYQWAETEEYGVWLTPRERDSSQDLAARPRRRLDRMGLENSVRGLETEYYAWYPKDR
ncbi:hypothetical protein B0O99DRAFT_695892 [Bisporella sp. PMI_857]|nr:hypothetical protein B0O99DRAFT_695892 [Bisporella sp. PMI_857]